MATFFSYFTLGLALSIGGVLLLCKSSKTKRNCTIPTTAQIVHVERHRTASSQDVGGSDRVQYTPVYEYNAAGVRLQKKGRHYSYNRTQFQIGQPAVLFYNPQNPEEFYVPKSDKVSRFGIFVLLFGVLLCAIAFMQL